MEGVSEGETEHSGAPPQQSAGEAGADAPKSQPEGDAQQQREQSTQDEEEEEQKQTGDVGPARAAADTLEAAPSLSSACEGGKVVVLLKATGDAPILKQSKFKVNATDRVAKVADFVRKNVKKGAVYLYIASTFQPASDRLLGDLFDSYGTGGKLVFQYATTPAWG